MFTALDTGISKVKNVAQFIIGDGSVTKLGDELLPLRSDERSSVLFLSTTFSAMPLSLLGDFRGKARRNVFHRHDSGTNHGTGR